MQDKVGSKIPKQSEVDQIVAQVQAIEERLADYTVLLSSAERTSTVKMRLGGETIVPVIGQLASDHQLSMPHITVDGMNADLALAQRLRPLAAALEQLTQRVNDTILEAQSECWWAATAYYTALARLAGADASLEAALVPVVAFFSVGRRKKVSPAPAGSSESGEGSGTT